MLTTTPRRDAGRRRRRHDVRQRVTDAALALLADAPFGDLTVEQIAHAAGISRSAFYFYFEDKTAVLIHAGQEVTGELAREADRWWSGEGDDEQLVRDALTGITAVCARHRTLLRVAAELAASDPHARAFWRAALQRFIDATAEHLRAGDGGPGPDPDPAATADALVLMTERVCVMRLLGGERTPAQVVDELLPIWMAVLRRGGPVNRR